MSFPGKYRIQKIVKRFSNKAIILLYHKISNQSFDPQLLCVSQKNFLEHMEVLKKYFHPMSLSNLRKRKHTNNWSNGTVVVTFDDGYDDNFHIGKVILENFDVPATVFVTSGMVGSKKEFWWDELERIFFGTEILPQSLEIKINQEKFEWKIIDHLEINPSSSWNVFSETKENSRHFAYLELTKKLRNFSIIEREDILLELANWAGVNRNLGRRDYLSVNEEVLTLMSKNELIEIGAHTINHPVLSALDPERQYKEIYESKLSLENILNQPILSFAYPFGTRTDYTKDTVKIVRESGFKCACSNFPSSVNLFTDPYQLPRFIVRNWDGETFLKKLENWIKYK